MVVMGTLKVAAFGWSSNPTTLKFAGTSSPLAWAIRIVSAAMKSFAQKIPVGRSGQLSNSLIVHSNDSLLPNAS